MSLFHALLLGAVQGLTEFLPISSSGHLVLVQHLLHLQGDSLSFDVLLHFGTLLAVVVALRRDLIHLLTRPFDRLVGLLIISTIPTVAIGLIFEKPLSLFFIREQRLALNSSSQVPCFFMWNHLHIMNVQYLHAR